MKEKRSFRNRQVVGSTPTLGSTVLGVRPGDIGDRSYRRHRLHFWAKRVVERLQSFFLQIDVAEIVLHKADQPNTFFHLFDTNRLSREDRAEVDFFAVETNAPAVGDVDNLVVERVLEFRPAAVGAGGRGIDFRGALHIEGLVGPLIVELLDLSLTNTDSISAFMPADLGRYRLSTIRPGDFGGDSTCAITAALIS